MNNFYAIDTCHFKYKITAKLKVLERPNILSVKRSVDQEQNLEGLRFAFPEMILNFIVESFAGEKNKAQG